MGKKRLVTTQDGSAKTDESKVASAKTQKKKFDVAVLHVESTYNNTKALITDEKGNALAASSAGALGFKGAKKGTPFAAAKVGEMLAVKAKIFNIKDVKVVIKGVGSGRESVVRAFASKGFGLISIRDATPVPHNGPRPPRPRRV